MRVKKAKLWLEFIWEKKIAVMLYALTVFLFLLVAGLSHLEDYMKLAYAVPLSGFFCAAVGFFQGRKTVEKRQALQLFIRQMQSGAALEGCALDGLEDVEAFMEELGCSGLEQEYLLLVNLLQEENIRRRSMEREQNSVRNDYYLMWAHQIKTPIAAMKLLLGGGECTGFLLKEELFKIEQYVEMALHFQRLQSMEADMVLEECDLYELLKQAVKKYSVLFISKGVSLQLSEMSLSILTDEKWFCFCIEQFLSNSIKYTAKQTGRISVYLSGEEENTLVVEDNGIGIRQEDLPRIFERGFTGYNGRMDKKSTGIGLYLCRQILDRLGNEIRVESIENEGTRVFLKLRQSIQMNLE